MQDLTETKPFGTALIGLAAWATSYVAGAGDWRLIALPLVVMSAYQIFFLEARSR